jgi:hypothetical protein
MLDGCRWLTVTSILAFYDTKQICALKCFIVDTCRSIHGDMALEGKIGICRITNKYVTSMAAVSLTDCYCQALPP